MSKIHNYMDVFAIPYQRNKTEVSYAEKGFVNLHLTLRLCAMYVYLWHFANWTLIHFTIYMLIYFNMELFCLF